MRHTTKTTENSEKTQFLNPSGFNELQAQLDEHPELATQLAALLRGVQPGAAPSPTHTPRARKKKKSDRISYLAEDELASLFREIRKTGSVRDAALFDLALGRGLRAAEVGLVTMERWRVKDKRIYIERVKNGISNEYPLLTREDKALKAWLRERGDGPGPLFPSNWKRPISTRRLDQLMKEYAAAAGLPPGKWHFHCLRHTCATRLLEMGAHVEQVKDWLGHRDIKSTMVYAQVTDRNRRALSKQIEDRW